MRRAAVAMDPRLLLNPKAALKKNGKREGEYMVSRHVAISGPHSRLTRAFTRPYQLTPPSLRQLNVFAYLNFAISLPRLCSFL